MVPTQIEEHVRHFLEECIDSVPQLEALLIMFETAGRHWTVAEIGARVYISLPEAARVLERLARRGLVYSEDSGAHYQFQPGDDARRALVADVARTYRANLTLIATFIHEKPPASVTEFARAFDLKRDR